MAAKIGFLLASAARNIRYRKLTSSFTVVSYFVGLLLPAAILSSADHEITHLKSTFMIDSDRMIRVQDQTRMLPSAEREQAEPISDRTLYKRLREDPAVEDVSYKSEISGILSSDNRFMYVNVVYVDEGFHRQFQNFISRGEWFHPAGQAQCVVGTTVAKKLWGGSGIQKQVRVNGAECVVIGETSVYNKRVILLDPGREELVGMTDYYVKVKDPESLDRVAHQARSIHGWLKIDPVSSLNQRELEQANEAFVILMLLSLLVFLFSLIHIGNLIGLMLEERRQKYGIQLALGSGNRMLYLEFFVELLLLTSLALLIVFVLLGIGEPLIERHLFPIRVSGFVIWAVCILNAMVCAVLGGFYMRSITRKNIVRLIRGANS